MFRFYLLSGKITLNHDFYLKNFIISDFKLPQEHLRSLSLPPPFHCSYENIFKKKHKKNPTMFIITAIINTL